MLCLPPERARAPKEWNVPVGEDLSALVEIRNSLCAYLGSRDVDLSYRDSDRDMTTWMSTLQAVFGRSFGADSEQPLKKHFGDALTILKPGTF